jgi:quinoprotein glucose dehydrogenase
MEMDVIRIRGIIIPSDLAMRKRTAAICALAFAALSIAVVRLAPGTAKAPAEQDWPFYGGDQGGAKYSPLADINRETVARLAPAW